MQTKIWPSLLAAQQGHLAEQMLAAVAAGADSMHVDVMDGHFAPNIAFGPDFVAELRGLTACPFEVHLMIDNPDRFLQRYAAILNPATDSLTLHPEGSEHIHRYLLQIKEAGFRAGLALNPGTPLQALDYTADLLDILLIMSVNPGFSGQSFIASAVHKVQKAREYFASRSLTVDIAVDGGIDRQTAPLVVNAGATALVAGAAVFYQDNVAAAISNLRAAAAAGPEK